jgi:hypothetical protein
MNQEGSTLGVGNSTLDILHFLFSFKRCQVLRTLTGFGCT